LARELAQHRKDELMLILEFEGYFQDRMTTDPDPTDERRGVSGYTFAFAGEPDLDNIVYFQPDEPGVVERDFGPHGGPKVGVTVRRATENGRDRNDLVGGKVAFLGAQLLEHNGILIREDFFVIDPFHVTLTVDGNVLLDRIDYLDPTRPHIVPEQATGPQLQRRQPAKFTSNSEEVARATGLPNAQNVTLMANRLRRRESLQLLLDETTDAVQQAALESRIFQLGIIEQWWNLSQGSPGNRPIDRRAAQLALQASGWNIDMNGKIFTNQLGGNADLPWNVSFWMGGWDGDALCGYVKGTWTIPTR
jgi:hypothetical protein